MRRTLAAALAALALAPCGARAQDSLASNATPVAHLTAKEAAAFSKQIEDDLAGRGARVALVFRTGRARAKLPRGIAYTHGAFWVYRDIRATDGATAPGYAVYNLYAGDGKAWPRTESRLVQDFPFDFTRGSAVDDVAVIVPSPEMQRRILAVIDSPAYAALHNPSYSLIANPLSERHQNCTGFMLDVIAAAAWETRDPAQVRADERAHFSPAVIEADPLQRLFGPLANDQLKTDDQHGRLLTATYESVASFMKSNGLMQAAYSLPLRRAATPG